jgi:regulator of replication initiation timing
MSNLSEKFDKLTKNISKLLEIFESSAKTISEKDFNFQTQGPVEIKELTQKLENLIEQNKLIARGFTLFNEKLENHPISKKEVPKKEYSPSIENRNNSNTQNKIMHSSGNISKEKTQEKDRK